MKLTTLSIIIIAVLVVGVAAVFLLNQMQTAPQFTEKEPLQETEQPVPAESTGEKQAEELMTQDEKETDEKETPEEERLAEPKTEPVGESRLEPIRANSDVQVFDIGDLPVTFTVTVPEWTRPEDRIFLSLKTDCFMDEGWECSLPMTKIGERTWQVVYRENYADGSVIYRYNRNAGGGMTEEIVGEKDDLSVWREYRFTSKKPVELKDTVKQWRWLQYPKPSATLSDFKPADMPKRDYPFMMGPSLPDWYRKAFGFWVEPTMKRIRQKGFEWVGTMYLYESWPPGVPHEDKSGGTDLQVEMANKQGLNNFIHIPIETLIGKYDMGKIRDLHSDNWHRQFVEDWKEAALKAVAYAKEHNISVLDIDNHWMFFQYRDEAQERFVNSLVKKAVREINNAYDGLLVLGEHNSPNWDYLSEVDAIGVGLTDPLTDSFSPSLAELKEAIERIVDRWEAIYKKFNKPILVTHTIYGSYDGATGALEGIVNFDSPGISEFYTDDPQYPLDFQEQADVYEAFFQAIYDEPFIIGAFSFGYKYWDLHDKSPSIRDKPAEDVWVKWNNLFAQNN